MMNKKSIVCSLLGVLYISSVFSSAINVKTSSTETKAITYDHEEIIIGRDETDFFTSSYNLSKYLGNEDMKLTNGTGFFDTYQDENDTWWFVDPGGYAFYSVGRWGDPFYTVNIIKKYETEEEWANETREIIKGGGFNTFGCYENTSRNISIFGEDRIPYLYKFEFQHMGRGRWIKLMGKKVIPDVFDPYFWTMVEKDIIEVTNLEVTNELKLKDDPFLLGYFLGNEIHWESSPIKSEGDKKTLLEAYMFPEHFYPGKQMVVKFLKKRYENNGGITEFNKVWNMKPELTCWDELLVKNKLGRIGWKAQLRKDSIGDRIKSDINDFAQLVAKWFFKNVTEILDKYDPNHLTLGVRFHAWGAPEGVLKECGNYCDVISVNYYRGKILWYDLKTCFKSRLKGLVPLNNWMKNYNIKTDKPLLVAEWGSDPPFPFVYKLFNLSEKYKANYQQRFTRKCMERPYIIGVEGNYGLLVNESEVPYPLIYKKMIEINSDMYNIHGSSWRNN